MPQPLLSIDPNGPNAEELARIRDQLNLKERQFLVEYLVDMDVERACTAVGLRLRQAQGMLGRRKVKRAVQLVLAEREARTEVTVDKIVKEYGKLGFANMGDYLDSTADGDPVFRYKYLTRDQKAALSEVTVEDYVEGRGPDAREVKRVRFKLHDKKAALDSLARHLGMFVDRSEIRTEMFMRLVNMSREERLAEMHKLLQPMQRLLPEGETVDVDPEEEE